jgi:hypothetical protein
VTDRKYSRRLFPTFCKYADRRELQIKDEYDVMITNDSWLAAILTDGVVTKNVRGMKRGFDVVDDVPMSGAWRRTFDQMVAYLNRRAWMEQINHWKGGSK